MDKTKTIKFPAVTITEEEFDINVAKAVDAMMEDCDKKEGRPEMGMVMGLTSMMFSHKLKNLIFKDSVGGGAQKSKSSSSLKGE